MSIAGPQPALCKRCGGELEQVPDTRGCCADVTCPYFDHPQSMSYPFMTSNSRADVNAQIARSEGFDVMRAYRRRGELAGL
jgi:hypothetical protein